MSFEIEIFGEPTPQGSKRLMRGRIIEASSEKLKKWRRAIADACQANRKETDEFFIGPVAVEATFYLARPKSVKADKRPLPIVPPDVDKLARGLLDGIGQSEMIWGDDSQVIDLKVVKVYADGREPGASVRITAL